MAVLEVAVALLFGGTDELEVAVKVGGGESAVRRPRGLFARKGGGADDRLATRLRAGPHEASWLSDGSV